MLIALIMVSIALPIVSYLCYLYGKKKAGEAFMEMLFKFGYDTKVSAFKKLNTYSKPGGIVFVGDSITQDYNVYEYFKGVDVYNRGIGGDTSEGVLRRLDESVFALKPSQVFLQIGTNDFELLNAKPEEIAHRIKEIVSKIRAFDKDIKIHVISIYPVNPQMDKETVGKRTNEKIVKTNELIKEMNDITYLSIGDYLLKDGILNEAYSLEGLHLNQQGYEVVTKHLKKWLN